MSPLCSEGLRASQTLSLIPFPIINFLFGRRPALRAGRRQNKIPPTRIQKLFASKLVLCPMPDNTLLHRTPKGFSIPQAGA